MTGMIQDTNIILMSSEQIEHNKKYEFNGLRLRKGM